MKKFILLLLFLLPFYSSAQSIDIRGTLVDSLEQGLPSASVVLLQAADSVMSKFSISNLKGEFRFERVKPGAYIVQVSYLGFQNQSQALEVKEGQKTLDLGKIYLKATATELKAIQVLSDKIPMVIKEDTIEYRADAFKVQANANVEDLLKKLPGIEVDEDGTIKAQGEEVRKVLVDGKEFFGNDPKMATKNLPADALDKVQVFDQLSEMAQFTGVDDGERDKTLNLSLKEDRKKGLFGKLSAGYGTNARYRLKNNLNRFNKNTQLSVIGNANNINEQDYSFDLNGLDLGGGLEMLGGNLGGGNAQGINENALVGLNLNHQFSEKTRLFASYQYNYRQNDLFSESLRQNFAQAETFQTASIQDRLQDRNEHRFKGRFDHTFSEGHSLRINTSLGYDKQDNRDDQNSETRVSEDLRNQALVSNQQDIDNINLRSDILYRLRLKKPGRTLSARLRVGYQDRQNDGSLESENQTFSPTNIDLIRQIQKAFNESFNYEMQVSYTEPIAKKHLLQSNYSLSNRNQDVGQNFFDLNDADEALLNELLSRQYGNEYTYHRGGLALALNAKKSTLTFRLEAQDSGLSGELQNQEMSLQRNFFNILPSVLWRLKFNTGRNLNMSYRTSVRAPSLEQLQPLVDNRNPLRIYQGNENLGIEYQHRLNLNYMHFDSFSFTSFFMGLNFVYTRDKISNSSEVDESFRQLIRPINVDWDYALNGNISFSRPLGLLSLKFRVSSNQTFQRSILFVNQNENQVNRWIHSYDFRLENRHKKVVDAQVGTRLSITQSRFSQNSEQDQDFNRISPYAEVGVDFLKRWSINSNFTYSFYSGEGFQQSAQVPLWRASISCNFLKFDRGQLKLDLFDILNQNQGVNRNSQFNFIEDQSSNVLGRYVLLSFTYSLSSYGGKSKKK